MFLQDAAIILSDEDVVSDEGKNFEMIKQAIALRATPMELEPLRRVRSLSESGSDRFVGLGYVWEFAIEAVCIFEDDNGPIGLLISELHNIVLPCGETLHTMGTEINLEFQKLEPEA
jgi:hypothetical protein